VNCSDGQREVSQFTGYLLRPDLFFPWEEQVARWFSNLEGNWVSDYRWSRFPHWSIRCRRVACGYKV